MRKCQLTFPRALKSFLGYLEGTEKAEHTIRSYRLDLLAFESFLSRENAGKEIRCEALSVGELERYHFFLKTQGHKTNTRRRKLLTAQKFLRYLSQRNELSVEIPKKMAAPSKVERVPFTLPRAELIERIRALPDETVLDRRNRALLWTLAETGCLVSEVTLLKFENFEKSSVSIPGKSGRTLGVSRALTDEIATLAEVARSEWIFLGFNKHGPLGGPISPRGVELLVRAYAARLESPKLTPRVFRHSVVLDWFKEGVAQAEIQKRLGLRSAYAFRVFAPLLLKTS